MNSNGKRKDTEPFHRTLLVLDQKEGDWLHYNSLRPRLAKTVDHYFDDARILVCLINRVIIYVMFTVSVNAHPLKIRILFEFAETVCGELQLYKC